MEETADGGAIHNSSNTHGTETGCEIGYNLTVTQWGLVTDTAGNFHYPSMNEWGVYLDTYASNWSVHDNVIRQASGGWFTNCGASNVFQNNFVFDAVSSQTQIYGDSVIPTHGDEWLNNVFYYSTASYPGISAYFVMGDGNNNPWATGFQSNKNNFNANSGSGSSKGLTWTNVTGVSTLSNWQNKGYDKNSQFNQNPLIVSESGDDYRLQSGSPLPSIGTHGLDYRPTITTQPQSATVSSGGSVTFSVVPGNVAPRFQWFFHAHRREHVDGDNRRDTLRLHDGRRNIGQRGQLLRLREQRHQLRELVNSDADCPVGQVELTCKRAGLPARPVFRGLENGNGWHRSCTSITDLKMKPINRTIRGSNEKNCGLSFVFIVYLHQRPGCAVPES